MLAASKTFKAVTMTCFHAKDLKAFCGFGEYVLKRKGYGHIFCSAVQYAFWQRRFHSCSEEVEKDAGKTDVFKGERSPSFYSRDHVNYLQDPQFKRLRHTYVKEKANHFWRE